MKKNLLDQLLDPNNIYKAIYSLESYVFEKGLLSNADIKLYNELSDKFNSVKIKSVIVQCKEKLYEKLISDELFNITVFFKPKKFEENKKEIYRPMHTADLITQICIVSMLNLIMFDDSDDTRKLSDICKLIPSNFYGNIPSTNVDRIFEPWSKKFIVDSFHIVNKYFEESIRLDHQKNSAKFIKSQSELKFIEQVTRQLVADISEAHGFETKDVYGLKSNAKNDTISEKYLMIILRLADLLDMSKDRVSINILKQNIKHMPEDSKFHWISHMAISKCTIETEFENLNTTKIEKPKKIRENVIVRIYLNTKQLTSIENGKPCNNINCKIRGNKSIEVSIKQTIDTPCAEQCNFTSKWMAYKHNFLFKELYSLQKYLSRNSNTIFETSFKVIFEIDNTNRLSPEFLDVINNQLN